jgi:hypothetical protein
MEINTMLNAVGVLLGVGIVIGIGFAIWNWFK